MIKPTYTKPPEFKNSKAKIVAWADKVYVKKYEICLYFNSAEYNRFIRVSIADLGNFEQATKLVTNLYKKATKENSQSIKSHVEVIVGELFRMGVIQ